MPFLERLMPFLERLMPFLERFERPGVAP